MSFKIKYQTKSALFHVKIDRDVSEEEIKQLAQIAINITREKTEGQENLPAHSSLTSSGINGQTKLGERPVDTINFAEFKEPKEGVRIKMLSMPANITKTVMSFRRHTGISIVGSKEIVLGNFKCPILKPEVAEQIMNDFRDLEMYAKTVPAEDRN